MNKIIIVILILSNFYFVFKYKKVASYSIETGRHLEAENKTASENILKCYNCLNYNYLYGSTSLKDVFLKEDSAIISLKHDINNTVKVVMRFSDISCNYCYEEEIKKLQKYSKLFGEDNIALLVSFQNERDLNLLKEKLNITYRIYNSIDYNLLGLSIEESHKPFLFLLDTSLNINHIYIPDTNTKNNFDEMFYDLMLKKYF